MAAIARFPLLLIALLSIPVGASATSATPGTCASKFDDGLGLSQACADIQGIPLVGGKQPFAFSRFDIATQVTEDFVGGQDGVPDGINASAFSSIAASGPELAQLHSLSFSSTNSMFDSSAGTKIWAPVSFYGDMSNYAGGVDISLDLTGTIGADSSLGASYEFIGVGGQTLFSYSSSFSVVDDGSGGLSVDGFALVNGALQPFTETCGSDSCAVGVDVDGAFMVQAGIQLVDGVLFGSGGSADSGETFSVVLQGPEGTVFGVVVPEPRTAALVGIGVTAIAAGRRRRAVQRT